MNLFELPHRRLNPLTGEWVLVSPQRSKRPWLGQIEKTAPENLQAYDPTCYLCPGNERADGEKNPAYINTFVFNNDFAALLPPDPQDKTKTKSSESPLFNAQSEGGICRVICFSPRHDLTLPELPTDEIEKVIDTWAFQTKDLFRNQDIEYVQVFENKGALMGCSNPHPHSQIWAQSHLPNEIFKEVAAQKGYFSENGIPLLLDYLKGEMDRKERIIATNTHFTAMVPFWAVWPFEILLSAHRPVGNLFSLDQSERHSLAALIKEITTLYDNLFEISFPYSMGFHQAPNDQKDHPEWVLHAHFYPPLLRSATVRKFMVGYEMLAMPQRDITPEVAASRLRELPSLHYRNHK